MKYIELFFITIWHLIMAAIAGAFIVIFACILVCMLSSFVEILTGYDMVRETIRPAFGHTQVCK